MRFLFLLMCLLPSGARSETVDAEGMFSVWAKAVDAAYVDRSIRYATVHHEFRHIVLNLPQSQKLIETPVPVREQIVDAVKVRYKSVLTEKRLVSESDNFLGLLYCALMGLDPQVIAGCSEAGTYNLDHSLGQSLFGVEVENPWAAFLERVVPQDSKSDSVRK